MTDNIILGWSRTDHEHFTMIEFKLIDDLIKPADLSKISLPDGLESRRSKGLVISGRGPVWLFGHLLHLAHPFAWVATFDPRLDGGVVVQTHIPSGPCLGDIIPVI